jgi:hypothetical protein
MQLQWQLLPVTGVPQAAQHARMYVTYVQETNVVTHAPLQHQQVLIGYAGAHRSEALFGTYS